MAFQIPISRVLMGWGKRGGGDILWLRLSFLIGTHSIVHACRRAIPVHRRWLCQLGMTASSLARPRVNPHTRRLHQQSRGTSMTADPPARPSVNPHTRWLHQPSLGMSMTAYPPARPRVNAYIGWLHQLSLGSVRCPVCKVWYNSEAQYQQHCRGRKHRLNSGLSKNAVWQPRSCSTEAVVSRRADVAAAGTSVVKL